MLPAKFAGRTRSEWEKAVISERPLSGQGECRFWPTFCPTFDLKIRLLGSTDQSLALRQGQLQFGIGKRSSCWSKWFRRGCFVNHLPTVTRPSAGFYLSD